MRAARILLGLALGRRYPIARGRVAVRGLRARVTVRRDGFGVPYVDAAHELDAWLALGFCHAQDRAAQLEIIQRVVRGTLAELVGPDALALDRLARRIGFRRAGEAQLAVADARIAEQLHAYARGINQGLERGLGGAPHELALLGRAPSRWEAADAQGYSALLCFALASNWDAELARLMVLERDGPDAVRALETPYARHLPVSSPPGAPAGPARDHVGEDLARLRGLLAARTPAHLAPLVARLDALASRGAALRTLAGLGAAAAGSNGWAVAPARTATGRPILANDPHLEARAPALYYLARLRWPGGGVAGASVVGVPAFAPGHNGHAAWGVTAAHADNTDLFLEELSPDGTSLRSPHGWSRAQAREERFEVRGAPSVVERVLAGPRGPIVTDDAGRLPPPIAGEGWTGAPELGLSLAASWLAPRPYTGFFGVHHARTHDAFRNCFRQGSVSSVSAVYADADGHIGWHLGVEIPVRAGGWGTLPMPGWSSGAGWAREPAPFDALPRELDPACGFVCAANNQPASAAAPFLGADWLDGWRMATISEALAARADWSLAATRELQLETRSLPWRAGRARVLALSARAAATDPYLARARAELERWDGRVDPSSVGATVYELFVAALCRRLVRAAAPRSERAAIGKGLTPLLEDSTLATRRIRQLAELLREPPVASLASWAADIETALAGAVRELESRFGPDPTRWRWGRARPLVLGHAFSRGAPLIGRIFDIGPLEGFGDATTVAQGAFDLCDPLARQISLPVLRARMDVGRWDEARYALAGGQSGNPLSPHYDDQLAAWATAEGLPLVWSEDAVRARARTTLTLEPDR